MDMEPSIDTIDENPSFSSANFSELLSYLEPQEPPVEGSMMRPSVEITEQPRPKVRFRYECEGRSAGSIMGANSTSDTKSYPSIKIRDYQGEAHVVVSCVTVDEPYRPHPHKLVGKDNCRDGIFFTHFENSEDMRYTFTNLGIQCMKKKDIKRSLEVRESQGVDPFETGYSHRENTSSINLNAVRLCFQVFLPISGTNNVRKLKPIVSEPIFDTKSNSDLIIHELSHASAPVAGGTKMILLCDKVNKDDVRIRFFEEEEGGGGALVWEAYGDFCDKDVHKQVAIVFRTPPYRSFETSEPVNVKVQLANSKGSLSEPYNFKLTPLDSEEDMKRKRHKTGSEYYRSLKTNFDMDKKRKRGAGGSTGPPSVKVEAADPPSLYQWQSSGHVSPYQHSRTPSPSYAGQSYQPNVYAPSTSQAVFASPPNPFSTPPSSRPQASPDPLMLYPISPNNAVFVSNQQTHTSEPQGAHSGAAGGVRFPSLVVTDMDTQETTYERRPGDSLNEVDSADLLDPGTLSQNLNESLNISEANVNNSDSLTHIANDAYNNLT